MPTTISTVPRPVSATTGPGQCRVRPGQPEEHADHSEDGAHDGDRRAALPSWRDLLLLHLDGRQVQQLRQPGVRPGCGHRLPRSLSPPVARSSWPIAAMISASSTRPSVAIPTPTAGGGAGVYAVRKKPRTGWPMPSVVSEHGGSRRRAVVEADPDVVTLPAVGVVHPHAHLGAGPVVAVGQHLVIQREVRRSGRRHRHHPEGSRDAPVEIGSDQRPLHLDSAPVRPWSMTMCRPRTSTPMSPSGRFMHW